MYCTKCGTSNRDSSNYCVKCGEYLPVASGISAKNKTDDLRWHNYMINYGLFFTAGMNIVAGFIILTGTIFLGVTDDWAYVLFKGYGLRGLDIVFSLILLALAAFAIYARHQLASLKANAPKLLLRIYAYRFLGIILYTYWMENIWKIEFIMSNGDILLAISSVTNIIINALYYRKYMEIFVN